MELSNTLHGGSLRDLSELRPSRLPSASPLASQLGMSSLRANKTYQEIISIIDRRGLPGPLQTLELRKIIGQGSQFVVYSQNVYWATNVGTEYAELAVKQPKFDLEPSKKLDPGSPQVQRCLEHIYLEIKALAREELYHHTNIVKLLGWSYENSFHQPITLIQELATWNLKEFLRCNKGEIGDYQTSCFCRDIAAGLDAIHKFNLIHGDLKPENVLLFVDGDTTTAKISDFGLSIDDINEDVDKVLMGGTLGWMAPEIEQRQPIRPCELIKADNYSFGLVALSTLLESGDPPPSLSSVGIHDGRLQGNSDTKKCANSTTIHAFKALWTTLQHDPNKRPLYLLDLIQSVALISEDDDGRLPPLFPPNQAKYTATPSSHEILILDPHEQKRIDWEHPGWPEFFLRQLYAHSKIDRSHLTSDANFNLFLFLTKDVSLTSNSTEKESLGFLLDAAKQGHIGAQAIVPLVFESYQEEVPADILAVITPWLQRAVSSGSILARKYLEARDPQALSTALYHFSDTGGYIGHYDYDDIRRFKTLHNIAGKGSADQLQEFMKSFPDQDIEEKAGKNISPLFLACARGAWDIVLILLEQGADASIACGTRFGITCLHWIFAFASHQLEVTSALVKNGANVNAVVPKSVPFWHYPFFLPSGTPLHWAVIAGSHAAIRALLEHGADPAVRDGCDPYTFDPNIRHFEKFGGIHQEAFSAKVPTRGLSSLDYAAMEYDPFLFEHILHSGTNRSSIDTNATDEEGMTVLHRLGTSYIRRTRVGTRYSYLAFRGSLKNSEDQLKRTIAAIKLLGGNLEQLTTKRVRGAISGNYTPLMVAVYSNCTDVVRALLHAGTDASTENEEGKTALYYLGHHSKPDSITIARILLEWGASPVHRDRKGRSPLVYASLSHHTDFAELLLSRGGNIEDTMFSTYPENQNVFMELAARSFYEGYDIRFARILDQYVFNNPDVRKRKSVIMHKAEQGMTLLHVCAYHGLRRSVEGLIRHGAEVNAPMRHFIGRLSREQVKDWIEFPLDKVIKQRQDVEERMLKYKEYSSTKYYDTCARMDAVIKLLKEAGGVQAPSGEENKAAPGEGSQRNI